MPPSRWLWRESHGHVRPSAPGTKSWLLLGLPGGSAGKESTPSNAGDLGSIPGWGRSPGGGHGSPLQCSCLENPTDRGAWRATVHGAAQSQTRLSDEAHRLQTAGLACSLWESVLRACRSRREHRRAHTRGWRQDRPRPGRSLPLRDLLTKVLLSFLARKRARFPFLRGQSVAKPVGMSLRACLPPHR